ncbi:MAG: class I SAM-dependent methyltransferase [Paludibacter sp.]|nr:class I SAM-dependent methyltransferase [Paludibacter sp.]
MKKISYILRYFRHAITARNTGGYGVHSPLIFNFIQYVLKEKHPYYIFREIEKIRRKNLNDHRKINVTDFGSRKSESREISCIAALAVKPPEQAQLLFRIICYFRCKKIMELGTSLGITTMYMAAASSHESCITLEGCSETATVARENFRKLGMNDILLIECNISEQLENIFKQYGCQDFIFIDANHRYEALIEYFDLCANYSCDNTVIVVDDIYWSDGMQKAWNEIKNHPRVTTTIDIFHMGIVFVNPVLSRKDYKIRW